MAVKPHAGPVLHAIHYLLGNQSRDQLERFRGFGGAQSYPSPHQGQDPGRLLDRLGRPRRRDHRLRQPGPGLSDRPRRAGAEADAGRMIALMGDAELDEGNIYEA